MGLIRTIKEILIDIKEIFEEIAFSIGIEDKNFKGWLRKWFRM